MVYLTTSTASEYQLICAKRRAATATLFDLHAKPFAEFAHHRAAKL